MSRNDIVSHTALTQPKHNLNQFQSKSQHGIQASLSLLTLAK
jgi:hypothetical protein